MGEPRSMYIQTNALTGKNCITGVHRGSFVFMVTEVITEELSTASAGTVEFKTNDVSEVSVTFFKILNPDQSYPFQNDSKNIPR